MYSVQQGLQTIQCLLMSGPGRAEMSPHIVLPASPFTDIAGGATSQNRTSSRARNIIECPTKDTMKTDLDSPVPGLYYLYQFLHSEGWVLHASFPA